MMIKLLEWRYIVGYEKLYKINDNGDIIRLARECVDKNGVKKKLKERILSQSKTQEGYLKVCLTKNKKETTKLVHRLVAEAFIENPENKPQINHKNGIKTDNRLDNLEWCTRSENIKHSYYSKLRKPQIGSSHGISKLKERDVISIRKSLSDGECQYILADIYGVDQSLISKIKTGLIWKHVKD
jgi:hypothetical protein